MDELQPEIVKIDESPRFGLHHWYLFGLNVFDYNDVACPIEQRPDVQFLTHLTGRLSCCAHVGSLALKDRVHTPEEMFGKPDGPTPYTRTRVGYAGAFYDLDEFPCFDACFFPKVTPLFWQALLVEENDLEQMLCNHGLAFYVAPRSDAMVQMGRLLADPFPGEAQWLTAVTDLYGLVLTVGHDGQYFEIYAKDADSLRLIEPSLTFATAAVLESAWFKAHKEQLVWDDDLNLCFRLPRRVTGQ